MFIIGSGKDPSGETMIDKVRKGNGMVLKMKKSLCVLLAAALLGTTACSVDISFDAGQKEADTGGQILDGRWLNSDIIGNVTEDTPADLKDDFALYVNKEWTLQAELPDGFASITPLSECNLIIMERMKKLFTDDSLTGHDAELVHKLYALVTDWEYRAVRSRDGSERGRPGTVNGCRKPAYPNG